MNAVDLRAVVRFLRHVTRNWKDREAKWAFDVLAREKETACSVEDEDAAKQMWIYGTILSAQESYIGFFRQAKERLFYPAWCDLEKVEKALLQLRAHVPITPEWGLEAMARQIPRFQSVYPYRVFMSPGYVVKERKCSTCGARVLPRSPCGHTKGQIYHGEMCFHIAEKIEILEISAVTDPVNKYTVQFLQGEDGNRVDQFDYGLVDYILRGLVSPFDQWECVEVQKRHPHSCFPGTKPDSPCPCESGATYEECCLGHPQGVLRPHYQVTFEVPPPSSLPSLEYTNDHITRAKGHEGRPIPDTRTMVGIISSVGD